MKNGKLSLSAQSVILNAALDCIRPYWFLLFCASLLELYIFQQVPKRQPPWRGCYAVADNWSSTSARIATQIKTGSPFFIFFVTLMSLSINTNQLRLKPLHCFRTVLPSDNLFRTSTRPCKKRRLGTLVQGQSPITAGELFCTCCREQIDESEGGRKLCAALRGSHNAWAGLSVPDQHNDDIDAQDCHPCYPQLFLQYYMSRYHLQFYFL